MIVQAICFNMLHAYSTLIFDRGLLLGEGPYYSPPSCNANGHNKKQILNRSIIVYNIIVMLEDLDFFLSFPTLSKEWIGVRDIKDVGLYQNIHDLIDDKYHNKMCPKPKLDV